jgi:hypothetical protein
MHSKLAKLIERVEARFADKDWHAWARDFRDGEHRPGPALQAAAAAAAAAVQLREQTAEATAAYAVAHAVAWTRLHPKGAEDVVLWAERQVDHLLELDDSPGCGRPATRRDEPPAG